MNASVLSSVCAALLAISSPHPVISQENVSVTELERTVISELFLRHQKFEHLSAALSDTVQTIQDTYSSSTPDSNRDLFDGQVSNFEFTSLQLQEYDGQYDLTIRYRDSENYLASYTMEGLYQMQAQSIQDEIEQMGRLYRRAERFLSHPIYSDSRKIKEEMEFLIAVERGEQEGLVANWSPEYGTMLGLGSSERLAEILTQTGSIAIEYIPQDRTTLYGDDYRISFFLHDGSIETLFTDEYALGLLRE